MRIFHAPFGLLVFILTSCFNHVTSITHGRDVGDHVRISRAQGIEPPITDWEIGLREAVHQALLRDGYGDPSLRNYLQTAPFSGKQTVKAFGDIAILARGQVYATTHGFNFVQDPYHNDCEGCHNDRRICQDDVSCAHFRPHGQLLALWTVKRIRHRDDDYGHRYEIEYTISPVDKSENGGYLRRSGNFDYGLPGHVFVIRSNPRYTSGYQNNRFFASPDQVKWHRQYLDRPLSDQYPNVLKPQIYQTPKTHVVFEATPSTTDPQELQIYRNLFSSLDAKTTTGHRFKIAPQSTIPHIPLDGVTSAVAPTRTTFQITSPTTQKTTFIQFPTNKITPITTSTTSDGQLQILTPVQIVEPFHSVPITNGFQLVPTQPIVVTNKLYTETTVPDQIPSTQVPLFVMKELVPPSVRPEIVNNIGSTEMPKKTTLHFFAAEADSTKEDETTDDIFKPTRRYSARTQSTRPAPTRTTKDDYDDDNFDLFPTAKPTEAMRRTTEVPFRETSPSVNQVPRPYKDTATTLPYSSTSRGFQTTFERRVTIPLPSTQGTTTTELSTTLGGTKTTMNTTQQQTTILKAPILSTIQYQDTTTVPTTLGVTTDSYNGLSTIEPRENIITITPVQTVPIEYGNRDESTASTLGYIQRTLSNTERFTETQESPQENLAKTTFVYPNTRILSTTFPPKFMSSSEEHTMSTAQTYNTNTQSIPTTGDTTLTDYGQYTQPYLTATTPTQSTHLTTSLKTTQATRLATTKLKPSKNTTPNNDFLVEDISDEDNSESVNKNRSKFTDYTDDDIFGPAENKKNHKQNAFTTDASRTVAKTPKIIYSDFYEASTAPPTTSLTQFYAESQNNFITQPLNATTERLPLTSQSYLTSISYEVNKKNTTNYNFGDQNSPFIKAKLTDMGKGEKLQIFKAEMPDTDENTTYKLSDKEAFDNIALQLVNHARSLDLLNEKAKVANNVLEEKKAAKYKRRNLFNPKSKRNQSLKPKI